jgi:histone H3/H4
MGGCNVRKTIRTDDLCLALDNPRFTDSQDENEELQKIVNEQKQKIVVLAEDIIDHGLNPLDTVAVYPSEIREGKYIVAEGNRRIAAIKILNDPKLIASYDQSVYNKISQLKLKYKPINEVDTWVFNNSSDPALLHWIEIRHMGEQKGKGVSKWNSIQKERFDKKIRGESRLLDFWADLEKYKVLEYDQIMSITKTNWERILREVGISFLGIHKSGQKLVIPMDDLEEFTKKMRCVHKRLANQTVGIVYDQEKIDAFFDDVSMELYGERIDKDEQLTLEEIPSKVSDFNNVTEDSDKKYEFPHEATTALPIMDQTPTTSTSKDLFNGCKTIIPYGYPIRSSNTRINRIIHELKTLNTDEFPNSCGTLLRLLFELSAKYYKESNTLTTAAKDDFKNVIINVANKQTKSGSINDHEHSALIKDIDTLRLLFNGYMHNTETYPSSEAIKSIFKAHKKFIAECLK